MKKILILCLVVLFVLVACTPKEVTIYFKDGSTISCDRIQLGETFVICTHIDGLSETQESFRSEKVESIR